MNSHSIPTSTSLRHPLVIPGSSHIISLVRVVTPSRQCNIVILPIEDTRNMSPDAFVLHLGLISTKHEARDIVHKVQTHFYTFCTGGTNCVLYPGSTSRSNMVEFLRSIFVNKVNKQPASRISSSCDVNLFPAGTGCVFVGERNRAT